MGTLQVVDGNETSGGSGDQKASKRPKKMETRMPLNEVCNHFLMMLKELWDEPVKSDSSEIFGQSVAADLRTLAPVGQA